MSQLAKSLKEQRNSLFEQLINVCIYVALGFLFDQTIFLFGLFLFYS